MTTSNTKKISKRSLRNALKKASDPQSQEILQIYHENPGAVLGISDKEFRSRMNTAGIIHDDSKEQELLLVARALIHCGLPYRSLKDDKGNPITEYRRTVKTAQGKVKLIIAARDHSIPLPFGKDRAVLAWLQTKAKMQGNPVITWSSASEFFRAFDLTLGGTAYRQFKESWKRLSNAVFTFEFELPGREVGELIPLFANWDLPTMSNVKNEEKGQNPLRGINYSVVLSDSLFKHLQESVVPLRLEVMRHFHDEPKAWDVVAFIQYRSWICQTTGVAYISWQDFFDQLGTHDKDSPRLRTSIRKIFDKLHQIWPEGQFELLRKGTLIIKPPLNAIHPVREK